MNGKYDHPRTHIAEYTGVVQVLAPAMKIALAIADFYFGR
jgi:hypothetical protein